MEKIHQLKMTPPVLTYQLHYLSLYFFLFDKRELNFFVKYIHLSKKCIIVFLFLNVYLNYSFHEYLLSIKEISDLRYSSSKLSK